MREYAILCPGQGAQAADMFDLAASDPRGREVLDAFCEALGVDVVARARSGEGLFENDFAQPALVAAAAATWAALRPHLPAPSLFAGYSVGEVSAWGCAGAFSPSQLATATDARARAMDRASPPASGMLAVRGMAPAELAALDAGLYVAIVNAVDHVVIAGDGPKLSALAGRLAERGATTRRLDVRVPSHTPLLQRAAEGFATFLQTAPLHDVDVPVLRGIDGQPCRRGLDGAAALSRAVAQTVRWDQCQRGIEESGVRVTLELGPGRALTQMATWDPRAIESRSVADFRSIDGVVRWLLRQLEA